MNAWTCSKKQRGVRGDMRYLGWIADWPKQNKPHGYMATPAYIHFLSHSLSFSPSLSQRHIVIWSSFCLLFGFFFYSDYMTLCSAAEHFLEVMSWKDYMRAVKSTNYGVRAPEFKCYLHYRLDLWPWARRLISLTKQWQQQP